MKKISRIVSVISFPPTLTAASQSVVIPCQGHDPDRVKPIIYLILFQHKHTVSIKFMGIPNPVCVNIWRYSLTIGHSHKRQEVDSLKLISFFLLTLKRTYKKLYYFKYKYRANCYKKNKRSN